ncbi:MAG: hypothetical protein U9P38_01225 [Campylobacterota bacterium]|nr:hypothetical protein [Campylobacterota bacterium]
MKKIILSLILIIGVNVMACDLSAYNAADKALTKLIMKDDMKSASKASDKVLATLADAVSKCAGNAEVLTLQKTAIANDKTIKEYATH